MLISIIIPIYKVEPYIIRCIDSVLNQTYRELEVILVDDCSPDRSMELAKNCIKQSSQSKDLSFIYLRHYQNRGLSAARNTGIDAAAGEYVYFLDSDDEISPDCIEVLSKPLEQFKYDFVVGNYQNVGEYSFYQPLDFCGEICGQEQIAQSYLKRKWFPMAWNKLCRTDYLKGYGSYFQEGLIHEDELWSYQLALTATSIYGIKNITYYYIIRKDSIITSNDCDKMKRKANNLFRVLQSMYEFQEKNNLMTPIVWKLQRNFRNTTYNAMLASGASLYTTYSYLRKADKRSMITKLKMYPTMKDIIFNFDAFMFCGAGYIYRLLLRKYFAWRNHDKNYTYMF